MQILGCELSTLIWLCMIFISFWVGYAANGLTYKSGYINGRLDEQNYKQEEAEQNNI